MSRMHYDVTARGVGGADGVRGHHTQMGVLIPEQAAVSLLDNKLS